MGQSMLSKWVFELLQTDLGEDAFWVDCGVCGVSQGISVTEAEEERVGS